MVSGAAIVLGLALAQPLPAEQILLKDGSTVNGQVVSESEASLRVRVESPGAEPEEREIARDQIAARGSAVNRPEPASGILRDILKGVSAHRFFFTAGLLAVSLLVLLGTNNNNTAARGIFGTTAVIGLLGLLHYLFLGVAVPSLPQDEWRGPEYRGLGRRVVKEWQRVPEGGTLLVIQEHNFKGPWNEETEDGFLRRMVAENVAGGQAVYASGFVINGILWKTASAAGSDGREVFIWAAQFKQHRIAVVLSEPAGSRSRDRDLRDVADVVGRFR